MNDIMDNMTDEEKSQEQALTKSETAAPSKSAAPRKQHSSHYYKRLLMKGSNAQWQELMKDIRENYDIAYRVAEAVAMLKPEHKTVQTLWKSAIENAQPGIKIKLGASVDEDDKMMGLKRTKYSDPGSIDE